MFIEEAKWIHDTLKMIDNNGAKSVANFGSSSADFRKNVQPHIHEEIFAPLEKRGWKVTHIDMKEDDGIDIIADITDAKFYTKYPQQYSLVICTNMLEHVNDISLVVKNLVAACEKEGHILITVPYKYKKHLDPIDNMFRPKPEEIAALFNRNDISVIKSGIISIHRKEYYRIKQSSFPLWGYRERVMYHLGKRYKVSGILIKMNR